jgi:hypothetical protein
MAANEVTPARSALDLEREAVRAASEAGEIFTSPPALERSVAWHLRRKLLRFGLIIGVMTLLLVVATVIAALSTPQHHRPSAPPSANPTP